MVKSCWALNTMVRLNYIIGGFIIFIALVTVVIGLSRDPSFLSPISIGIFIAIALAGVGVIAGGELVQLLMDIEYNTRAKSEESAWSGSNPDPITETSVTLDSASDTHPSNCRCAACERVNQLTNAKVRE